MSILLSHIKPTRINKFTNKYRSSFISNSNDDRAKRTLLPDKWKCNGMWILSKLSPNGVKYEINYRYNYLYAVLKQMQITWQN